MKSTMTLLVAVLTCLTLFSSQAIAEAYTCQVLVKNDSPSTGNCFKSDISLQKGDSVTFQFIYVDKPSKRFSGHFFVKSEHGVLSYLFNNIVEVDWGLRKDSIELPCAIAGLEFKSAPDSVAKFTVTAIDVPGKISVGSYDLKIGEVNQ